MNNYAQAEHYLKADGLAVCDDNKACKSSCGSGFDSRFGETGWLRPDGLFEDNRSATHRERIQRWQRWHLL